MRTVEAYANVFRLRKLRYGEWMEILENLLICSRWSTLALQSIV
jgi:hypothetical protein